MHISTAELAQGRPCQGEFDRFCSIFGDGLDLTWDHFKYAQAFHASSWLWLVRRLRGASGYNKCKAIRDRIIEERHFDDSFLPYSKWQKVTAEAALEVLLGPWK